MRAWFQQTHEDEIYLSALVVGELRQGIELKRRSDLAAARALESWLEAILGLHGERILPIDQRIAQEWARLSVPDPVPVIDGLLAATALIHDLTVVTRNAGDFVRTGAKVLNPFARRA